MTVIKNDVINEYTNSGSDRYSITFEYDRPEQVTVRTYNSDTNEYEDVTDWVFDGATAIRFTGVVPDTFEIVRVTNISQSYGESRYAVFQQGSAIKAGDLNGNLELLRLAIEENANELDGQQDQINDLNDEIDRLDGRIDQEIIDRENGDQNLQDQIDDIETNIDQIEAGSLDGRYVNVTGDTMTGSLSMSNNKIDNLANPTLDQDAVNLRTLEAKILELQNNLNSLLDGRYVNVIGDTMTGVLRMSKQQIKDVQDPTADLDAVNLRTLKLYLGLDPDPDPDDDVYEFSRFDFTASGGETSVTSTLTLNPNKEFVYINGVLLNPASDYLVNVDNSTIDFTDIVLFNGDKVSIINFTANSVIGRETITVNSDEVRYTTSLANLDQSDLNVTINGVLLLPSDIDYGMVNASTFILSYPPSDGDILRVYNADCVRTNNTANTGDILFGVSEANAFTDGNELVFLNGKLLTPTDDYTVSSGRFINLTSPANQGDSVLIITP